MVLVDGVEFPHTWLESGRAGGPRGRVVDPTAGMFGVGARVEYDPPGSYRDDWTFSAFIADWHDQFGASA